MVRLKKIWLPPGFVIPGIRGSLTWYIKIRRPGNQDLLQDQLASVPGPPSSTHVSIHALREGSDLITNYLIT